MAEQYSFKIGATDDTKKGLDSSKKNIKDYKKEITKLLQKNQKLEDPFKKMNIHLKGVTKEFKKVSNVGSDLADTLKSVNREDVVIADKLAQKGKSMQQFSSSSSNQSQKSIANALQGSKGSGQVIQVLKVNKLETKNFSGKGNLLGKVAGDKLSEKIDKSLSEGLEKIGAGTGMIVGGFIAAIGVAYSVMAAKAQAFRSGATQQIQGLQQLGFGGQGEGTMGGFYQGLKGQFGGQDYYLTGQQQVNAMSSYARQTGAGRDQLNTMMSGGAIPLGALTQAYGLDIGQTAGTAGLLQRFGRSENGMGTLISTMAGAERSGMGGARMKEFLDAMQDAVSQAVYEGSLRSNSSMLNGLETLMGSNDERLKALAPSILKSSTQVMNQAAMLQGGPQSNFMFQAVKNANPNKNLFDVREQLASGDWLSNAQAALTEAKRRAGGNNAWAADILSQGLGTNIASPKAQQELMQMIEKGTGAGGKRLTEQSFNQLVQERLAGTSQMIEQTAKQDYIESIHLFSEANKDAAIAVTALREVIQTIVDRGYEMGKGTIQNTFGVNLANTTPAQKGFK